MELIKLDLNETKEEEKIIAAIDYNNKVDDYYKGENKRLREFGNTTKNTSESDYFVELPKTIETKVEKNIDSNFEDEVAYYLAKINELNLSNIEDNFEYEIPSRSHYQYERILRRLELESRLILIEIKKLLKNEGLSVDGGHIFANDEALEMKKIELIRKALMPQKEEKQQMSKSNRLIFVPTQAGDNRVISDIESMSQDTQVRFAKLFNIIKDGTFSKHNSKIMTGDKNLAGLHEVKVEELRLLYMPLDEERGIYAVLSAFIKKTDFSSFHRSSIANIYSNFIALKDVIMEKINDDAFLEEHEKYEAELFAIISPTSKNPTLQKKVGESQ